MTFLLSFFTVAAFAKPAGLSKVQAALDHIRSGQGFESPVTKTVSEALLDKKTKSTGQIYFSKGKMRLEFTEPEKLLLVFDGRYVWQESEFDEGERKQTIVTKMKAGELKKGNALLAALLGEKNVLKKFKMKKVEDGVFEFSPKDEKIVEVTELDVRFDKNKLKAIGYTDSLDNKVEFEFDDLKEKPLPAEKFQYKPPKEAEVSDL